MPDSLSPLTIVHTEASRGWGGQDIRVLREAEWFRGQGHTVYIVTPASGELFRRATLAGFDPIPMELRKDTQPGDFLRLIRLFRRRKPDVVAGHSSVDSRVALLAAAATGVKCRLRYRHVSTPVRASLLSRWQYGRLATHTITTGDSISKHLVDTLGLSAGKVTCVSTGVEAPAGLPDRNTARAALAAELGLENNAGFIGQVSVLRSWKGHTTLMDAFAMLADEHPRLNLVCIGDGPIREALERHRDTTRVANRIHFVGHKENPWPYFRALDICTLCSVSGEGIPQALMQAMLAETPVIGTSVGGIPEVVRHHETGLIVPPNNPSALAEAIRETFARPERTAALVETARRQTLAERGPDTMGRKILAIIRGTPAQNEESRA